MQNPFTIFLLSITTITLWTAFLLSQDKRGNRPLNKCFAAFLVALTFPQMDLYVNHVVQGGISTLSLVSSTFLWLKGPFIWIFINLLARQKLSLRNISPHFLLWFIFLIVLLGFPQAAAICIPLGMCHMLVYLLAALWRLAKMRRYITEVWYGFQNSAYYWLLYILGGLMVLVAVDLVVMFLVSSGRLENYDLLDYIAFPGFSIYVLSIAILSVYRPELLFREACEQARVAAPDELTGHVSKHRHLELDASVAQVLIKNLTQLMEEHHLYRQNDVSLQDLAKHLGISVNQVSELLNVHSGMSLYDYLNRYRLSYACRLLGDPNCHLRVLDVAFESGYNNKNSFYRAFKEGTGVTPSVYRQGTLSTHRESLERAS